MRHFVSCLIASCLFTSAAGASDSVGLKSDSALPSDNKPAAVTTSPVATNATEAKKSKAALLEEDKKALEAAIAKLKTDIAAHNNRAIPNDQKAVNEAEAKLNADKKLP